MKIKLLLLFVFILNSSLVSANLCGSVTDVDADWEGEEEASFAEELFTDRGFHGSEVYNSLLLECNRKRDNKGDEIRKVLTDRTYEDFPEVLKKRNLPLYHVKAKYKFFGIAWFKYSYLLRKKNGVWEMILPYKHIINDVVKNRIDFNMQDHAQVLYEGSQVRTMTRNGRTLYSLKLGAQPIAVTNCQTSTFFAGKEDKYKNQNGDDAHKRDRENKFISFGKIQYAYPAGKDNNGNKLWNVKNGCRVQRDRDLYWKNPATNVVQKVKPENWLLDNFIKVAEDYWSIPAEFKLRILIRDYNEGRFDNEVKSSLKNNDYIKVRFGTTFLPHSRQMYKANVWQPNNFSTMTTDGTYTHEVGHALGLDDEYGEGKESRKDCGNKRYTDLSRPNGANPFTIWNYTMCHGYGKQTNTIYQYIATSRYLLGEICKKDSDCSGNRYCNVRVGMVNRCLEDGTLGLGVSCLKNRQCRSNNCHGAGRSKICVCTKDSDCPGSQKCKKPLGRQNYCK